MNKIEISEEGVVYCDGLTCCHWIEPDTTCKDCPVDKLFLSVNKYYAEKATKEKQG